MSKDLHPLSETDYDAIEAAVMETERGRWFLAQYAERNRNSDTTVLLDAIKKLERTMQSAPQAAAGGSIDQVRFDLVEMAAAIAQTKREIASLKPDAEEGTGIHAATEELDAIVTATETATQDILESAENIQEITWTMREAGIDEEYCEGIDNLITGIYTACSFQDITGQRTSKVVAVLNYLEDRLEAMRHIWGGDDDSGPPPSPRIEDTRPDSHLLNGPQLEGKGHTQDDIDLMIAPEEELFAAVVSPCKPAPVADTPDAANPDTAPGPDDETAAADSEVFVTEEVHLDDELVLEDPFPDADDGEELVFEPADGPPSSGAETEAHFVEVPDRSAEVQPGKSTDSETVLLGDLSDDEKTALFS